MLLLFSICCCCCFLMLLLFFFFLLFFYSLLLFFYFFLLMFFSFCPCCYRFGSYQLSLVITVDIITVINIVVSLFWKGGIMRVRSKMYTPLNLCHQFVTQTTTTTKTTAHSLFWNMSCLSVGLTKKLELFSKWKEVENFWIQTKTKVKQAKKKSSAPNEAIKTGFG